jgi:hypothetical protein
MIWSFRCNSIQQSLLGQQAFSVWSHPVFWRLSPASQIDVMSVMATFIYAKEYNLSCSTAYYWGYRGQRESEVPYPITDDWGNSGRRSQVANHHSSRCLTSDMLQCCWFSITMMINGPPLFRYYDGFAQGIAEQRSHGTPAGWRNSTVEAFPSCRHMHVWRNAIRRMRRWRL